MTATRDRSLQLLYIDPDPDSRVIVELALQLDPNLEIVTAANPLDTIGALSFLGAFDALLVEARVLQKDRSSLAALCKQIGEAQMPIITLSAGSNGAPIDDEDAGTFRVVANMIKPFDPLGLADQVRSLLSGKLGSDVR